jgi:D-3-phosphoglycerate dehydrogenase / 2-oxoglutarate reductase
MRVLFVDIVPKLPMGNAIAMPSLDTLLGEADVVSFHVPDTPETRGMMTRERIFSMKRGAYLLNASRGTVVDLEGLADAIKSGQIAGAAIDVFPEEPKSNDDVFESPLRGLSNVILTPHIGGSTLEAQRNIGLEVAHKLVSYSDTGSTVSSVNFPNLMLPHQAGVHRLLHIHENRPGILAAINQIIGKSAANIVGQHLQTSSDVGYVVIDVDREGDILRQPLCEVPGTIRCRLLY